MRAPHTGPIRPRSPLLAALVVVLAACADGGGWAAEPGGRLAAGTWTGEVVAPGALFPIGVEIEVGEGDPPGILVRALDYMGFSGDRARDVRIDSDSLSFAWQPQRALRRCVLRPAGQGKLAGACLAAGVDDWQLRMIPPGEYAPVGLATQALERGPWRSAASENARVHARPSVFDSIDVGSVLERVEAARSHSLELLGGAQNDRILQVFLLADRTEMERVLGRTAGGFADPMSATVLLTGHGRDRTVLRHEVMHVLSPLVWGAPAAPSEWSREGLATRAGGSCQSQSLAAVARTMLDDGRLIPLRDVVENWYDHADLITYLEAGAFIEYLHERHPGALRAAWSGGVPALERHTRTSLERLESGWRAALANTPAAPAGTWPAIEQHGCG